MNPMKPSDDQLTNLRNEIAGTIYGEYYYELPSGPPGRRVERDVVDRVVEKIEAHYQAQAVGDKDVKQWMESLGFLLDGDFPPAYFGVGVGYVSTEQAHFFYEAFKTKRQHPND